jgi:hypothetical protein
MWKARRVPWWRIAFGLLGIAILGGPVLGVLTFARTATYDCNEHPPEATFSRYFGPSPPGVSDIRSTGHISLGGADVWLRFRVTDAALIPLLADYRRVKPSEAKSGVEAVAEKVPFTPFRKADAPLRPEHQVRWNELMQIKSPEVYLSRLEYRTHDRLVLDRGQGLVYFYHWNQ